MTQKIEDEEEVNVRLAGLEADQAAVAKYGQQASKKEREREREKIKPTARRSVTSLSFFFLGSSKVGLRRSPTTF